MIIQPASLSGAAVIDLQRRGDDRGFFARNFCADEFAAAGLPTEFVQQNMSWSARAGTLRGMHFQLAEHAEDKLIRCVRGAVFDVILDLREGSATFGKWESFELTAENRRQVLVPKGFAHGFQTLADDSEVSYLVSHRYTPSAERGIRWNDPRFAIHWPQTPTDMSPKDQSWPDYHHASSD